MPRPARGDASAERMVAAACCTDVTKIPPAYVAAESYTSSEHIQAAVVTDLHAVKSLVNDLMALQYEMKISIAKGFEDVEATLRGLSRITNVPLDENGKQRIDDACLVQDVKQITVCTDKPTREPSKTSDETKVCTRMTKSSFGSLVQTQDDDLLMLSQTFELAEHDELLARQKQTLQHKSMVDRWRVLVNSDKGKDQIEIMIDSLILVIICLNAMFIAISMDYDEGEPIWMVINFTFSSSFLIELAIKLILKGVRKHFCGSNKVFNAFDFLLICIDVAQLLVAILFKKSSDSMGNAPSASLFRVVRLAKLIRVIRLLKHPVYQDLLAMMQGMIGGMTTLMWSMLLFLIVVFIVSLLFRELLGRQSHENISEYFDSVPRAMLTTIRCSFGDCNTAGGAPIFEYVNEAYGGFFSVFYCMFSFVITIGLFNVISAIFVESTMEAATSLQSEKKQARLSDEVLWATRCTTLIRRLLDISPDIEPPQCLSKSVETIYEIEVPAKVIDEFVLDEEVKCALGELDIEPADHAKLSDILDPDNGGSIGVIELMEGIKRMRGDPRRSDIVTVDLMIRSIQRDVMYIKSALMQT